MKNKYYIEESGFIDENTFDNLIKVRESKCSNKELEPILNIGCDFEIVCETKEIFLNINANKIHNEHNLTKQIKNVLEIISIRKKAMILGWNTGSIGDNFYLRVAFSTQILKS